MTPNNSPSLAYPTLTPLGSAILYEQVVTTKLLVVWDPDALHKPCLYNSLSSCSKLGDEFTPEKVRGFFYYSVKYHIPCLFHGVTADSVIAVTLNINTFTWLSLTD